MITRDISVEVDLSPKELAQSFCDMDGRQQALFFNEIANEVNKYWLTSFEFQMQNVSDTNELTKEGRAIMRYIGEYANE